MEPNSAPYAAHPSHQMIKRKREGRTPRPLMPQHLPGRSKSTWRLRRSRPAPSVPRSRSSSLPSWWRCSPWVAEPVITLVSMHPSRRARRPSKRPSPQSTPCGLRSRPRGGTHRPARAGCRCTSPARRRAARRSTSFVMSTARGRASSSVAAVIRPRLQLRPLRPTAPSTPCRANRSTSRLVRRRRPKRASMPAAFRSPRSRQPR